MPVSSWLSTTIELSAISVTVSPLGLCAKDANGTAKKASAINAAALSFRLTLRVYISTSLVGLVRRVKY